MRRFSQRNHLVTLSDINITPLLDLAFVLLIIFIITTPLLEQSLKLNLPTGGAAGSTVRKDEVRTVEVSPDGGYVIQGNAYTLGQIEQLLGREFRANPNLAVYIRADQVEKWGNVASLIEVLRRLNIKRIDFATAIPR